tara:strand:+ start:786 stop:899 length:114 start_codon:yes stop_codon:yes gene_type:complete
MKLNEMNITIFYFEAKNGLNDRVGVVLWGFSNWLTFT